MPNPIPSTYFPGISLSANDEVVFTTALASPATFPGLDNAEADPATGDIRDMAYAILMRISERHGSASPKPTMATAEDVTSNSSFPDYVRNVSLTFSLEAGGTEDLRDEP